MTRQVEAPIAGAYLSGTNTRRAGEIGSAEQVLGWRATPVSTRE
jgi:hypothetical protein